MRLEVVRGLPQGPYRLARTGQRGLASLMIVSVLLLLITSGVLYLSQNMVSEQRAAAVGGNRIAAQEAAEAGLSWATGMINNANAVDAQCRSTTGAGSTFRSLYVQPSAPSGPIAPTTTFAGCKIGPTGLSCSCPTPSGSVGVSTASGPQAAFTVAFSPVNDATGAPLNDAVRVTATGCSPHAGPCGPGSRAGRNGPDAVSQASIILKLQPLLRSRPPAPLNCAGNCSISSSVQVINRDTNTNGFLVTAGGSIAGCRFENCLPLQGTPFPEVLKPADSALNTARTQDASCQNAAVFRRYFFQSLNDFAASSRVLTLSACADAASCSQALNRGLGNGYRAFVLPNGFRLDSSSGPRLGSDADPLLLVGLGSLRIEGAVTVHGMIFMNSPNDQSLILDNARVRGAVVSCGNTTLTRPATLEYAAQTMSSLLQSPHVFRRVSGSWTDLCSVDANGAVTCR